MNDEKFITALSELISDGFSILNSLTFGPILNKGSIKLYDDERIQIVRFEMFAESILKTRFGVNSTIYANFVNFSNKLYADNHTDRYHMYKNIVEVQVGILQAALDALNSGLTEDLFYQNEIVIFSDLFDEALECYKHQKYLTVGVYGRIIIETVVREFAKLKLSEADYVSCKSFEEIVIKLRKNDFILQPLEENLKTNYKVGSHAAHNDEEFKKYTKREWEKFLNFIQYDVLTLK